MIASGLPDTSSCAPLTTNGVCVCVVSMRVCTLSHPIQSIFWSCLDWTRIFITLLILPYAYVFHTDWWFGFVNDKNVPHFVVCTRYCNFCSWFLWMHSIFCMISFCHLPFWNILMKTWYYQLDIQDQKFADRKCFVALNFSKNVCCELKICCE